MLPPSPTFLSMKWLKKHSDLIQMWFWIFALVPTVIWWKDSVLWVAMMSIYANVKTSHAAHKAQKADDHAQEN